VNDGQRFFWSIQPIEQRTNGPKIQTGVREPGAAFVIDEAF
jgi:hypothetical protein